MNWSIYACVRHYGYTTFQSSLFVPFPRDALRTAFRHAGSDSDVLKCQKHSPHGSFGSLTRNKGKKTNKNKTKNKQNKTNERNKTNPEVFSLSAYPVRLGFVSIIKVHLAALTVRRGEGRGIHNLLCQIKSTH